jgi:hypothetical protein
MQELFKTTLHVLNFSIDQLQTKYLLIQWLCLGDVDLAENGLENDETVVDEAAVAVTAVVKVVVKVVAVAVAVAIVAVIAAAPAVAEGRAMDLLDLITSDILASLNVK